MKLYDILIERAIDIGSLKENVSASEVTTFKAGGNIRYIATPTNIESLIRLLKILEEVSIPHFIIGKGSNVLVSDKGYSGVFINLEKCCNEITFKDDLVTVGAGVSMSTLTDEVTNISRTGLEFACGIPGTLGGAIYMNAGAYGSEMKNIVVEALVLDEYRPITLSLKQLDLSYRSSIIKKKNLIVLNATLRLKKGNINDIRTKINNLQEQRYSKQPMDKPSAGSTFKRPEGHFVGKLITDCGLKGYTLGGAAVSSKHAGFIINDNNATATEIINLIDYVSDVVYKKNGVKLEPEVIILNR